MTHQTEDAACADLMERVLSEEHNRYTLVAGPAPPDEADQAFAKWLLSRGVERADLQDRDIKVDEIPYKAGASDRRRYFARISRFR